MLQAALVLIACRAHGQLAPTGAPAAAPGPPPATASQAAAAWTLSGSAYLYIVPGGPDTLQPTVTADRGGLHLEARYNYEAARTGSLWVGYNFSVGEKLTFEFTPMIGAVVGDTRGIAPGYTGTLRWRRVALTSQGEYVIDADDSSASFFYNWSELTLAPADWLRLGLVMQRTKLYRTEFDIQRGFLVGFSLGKVDVTGYVFNPDASQPTVVLAASVGF